MFYIIETQTNEDDTGSAIVTTKTDRNQAEADYHRVLATAAISNIYKHGAILMTDDCVPIMYMTYEHGGENNDE